MNVIDKIEKYLNEEEKINWKKVKEALINVAQDIFDKVDQKKIDGIIDGVKKKKPADLEDAIGIGMGFLRSD